MAESLCKGDEQLKNVINKCIQINKWRGGKKTREAWYCFGRVKGGASGLGKMCKLQCDQVHEIVGGYTRGSWQRSGRECANGLIRVRGGA